MDRLLMFCFIMFILLLACDCVFNDALFFAYFVEFGINKSIEQVDNYMEQF